jgi:hypothetical protein
MDQDHVTRAPWIITTLVSCLPVLVLGMGTALAHMLREDAAAADQPDGPFGGPADEDQSADHPDQDRDQDQPDRDGADRDHGPDQVQDQQAGTKTTVRTSPSAKTSDSTPPLGLATWVSPRSVETSS